MTVHAAPRSGVSRSKQGSQLGFTLIELLISMVLGIVVISAMLVMYSSGSTATRNAQAQGQMNEDANMALAVITQELRRAGFNPTRAGGAKNDLMQGGATLGGWNLFGCDTNFSSNTAAAVSALTCAAAGSSSSLALVSEGDLYSGKNTGANLPMDCIGNGVAATGVSIDGGNYFTIQTRLFIANNALKCLGNGGGVPFAASPQVLAENIESMSALFAVADPSPAAADPKAVLGYLTADGINNAADPTLAALAPVDRWNKVVAARICVVVMSETPVLRDQTNLNDPNYKPTYIGCDDASHDIADGRLRRAYRTTVLLRNHGVGYADS